MLLNKKITPLLLLLALFQYPHITYSNICSHVLSESSTESKESIKQERPLSHNNHITKQEHHSTKGTKNQVENTHNKKPISNAEEFQEWMSGEILRIAELLRKNKTIDESLVLDQDRKFLTFVEPVDVLPGERAAIQEILGRYLHARRVLIDLMPSYEEASELYNQLSHILTFQMSQYLAASGIFHFIEGYIPETKQKSIDNIWFYKLTILPQTGEDTPLGRLSRDFYNRYKEGYIIYEPFRFLIEPNSSGIYSPFLNTINLSELFFLNMNFRQPLVLHELLHAKIYNTLIQNPENPYLLSIKRHEGGNPLSPNYPDWLSFSEMVTYQQTSRILLRYLTANPESTDSNEALGSFINAITSGLGISHTIEVALSSALRSLDSQYSTEITTQGEYTFLNISFPKEHFTLELPAKHNNGKTVKERLELALQVARFHKNRYLIALTKAKKSERVRNPHRRALLLRALQSSQILAQKFDPDKPEESLRQLIDGLRVDTENPY